LTLFGIDAEYVVRDGEGRLVSCHELPQKGQYARAELFQPDPPPITRRDYAPMEGFNTTHRGEYGCDGVFLEATSMPTNCRSYLTYTLWTGVHTGFKKMQDKVKGRLRLPPTTEITLLPEEMMSLPAIAHEIGCRSSLNAYGQPRGPQPGSLAGPTRWTGFHLHLSGHEMYSPLGSNPDDYVKFLDRTVGLASVLMDSRPDEARRRRMLYGEAGCYRLRTVRGLSSGLLHLSSSQRVKNQRFLEGRWGPLLVIVNWHTLTLWLIYCRLEF